MRIPRQLSKGLYLLTLGLGLPFCSTQDEGSEVLADGTTSTASSTSTETKSDSHALTFECKEAEGDLGEKKAEVLGINGEKFSVAASWCFPPKSVGKANVLMIVDFSGSMAFSDPLVSGGCGRLEAAKTLLAKFKSSKKEQTDEVQVAVVGFSNEATVLSEFQPLETVEAQLTASSLCVAQKGTVYSAAFQTADKTLDKLKKADLKAPVYTYFVTDGQPSEPVDAAYAAAEAFKKSVASVHASSTVSAIFLTPPDLSQGSGGGPLPPSDVDPEDVLTTITGDKSQVRIANNAADLAGKIAELSIPTASIDPSTVNVLLSSKAGKETRECKKEHDCEVVVDPSDPGKWSVSLSFPLSGEEGQKIDNTAEIVGKRTDGSDVRAKAVVSFTSIR